MNLHATPQPYASIQRDPRVNSALLTDPAARADHRVCADLRAGADVCILANFDLGVAFQRCANGYSQFPCSSSHCQPQWKSYNDGSPFGLVFHRPCTQIHCSGYFRTISSITLVNLCVFSKTSRSASPVRINSTGGSKRNRYFWLRSSQMAYPGTTAAPVCNATRAIPVVVPAFFPKKSTNIASSGMVF